MKALQVLLVAKKSKISNLSETTVQRLNSVHPASTERMHHSDRAHKKTLDCVRDTLSGHHICERRIDELHASDFVAKDIVITIGGDGTVLAVNGFIAQTPVLAVNSDPDRSIGNYTRCNKDTFGALWNAWINKTHTIESIPRLLVEFDNDQQQYRILNDCLFTNHNPAGMTRYIIDVDGTQEQQFSSGVWISTGAGSTGAIHSAGMNPVSANKPALLYKVREPFTLSGDIEILEDAQLPPRGLSLTATIPGIQLYIDGAYAYKRIDTGSKATFSACNNPLLLLRVQALAKKKKMSH